MSANSSSSSSSSNSSSQFDQTDCDFVSIMFLASAFNLSRAVLLLPVSVFVLILGVHQSRSFTAATHLDVFTYHQAVMELIWALGAGLTSLGLYFHLPNVPVFGYIFSSVVFFGETLFHILTCLERYLAVVHPVTYRGLQNRHGAAIRNGCIVSAWLLSWMWACLIVLHDSILSMISFLCFLVLSLIIISVCSCSVLCALIRPGPGDRDRTRGQMDQMKLRAFFTVTAIMAAVFLWFFAFLIATAAKYANVFSHSVWCAIDYYVMWFSLPSSLTLPLLYMHKKGAWSNS
ncbi:uncharacterized protein LOC103149055 [Poecilia formosa]|uniref:uncharacterized protein LOC103149055 n=1 Tax=Poecilia formosa TaxID=48698 RepID=UPI000444687E|nr:PREDICTED: uncharacterized protein LOC103149055 [Poecilia formosa]